MPPKKRSRTEPGRGKALGSNEAPTRTPSPPSSNPGGTPLPPAEVASSQAISTRDEKSDAPKPGVSLQAKPENWVKLGALIETLKQGSAVTGLRTVKNVIEGLVDLIGLYEDVVQVKTDFDDLRTELESIFDELNHHLSSSPVVTTSMDNICWSIQKEINSVKALQGTSRKRKPGEVDDNASVVVDCYRRVKEHLQRLTRNANISTWNLVDQLATESRLQKLASSLWECYNSIKANELKRGSCTAGTRISVLTQMYHWATSQNTGTVYWMSGMAGTGKTTIAYTLCEQLDGKDNRVLCASFFCSRSLPECRDVGRIIPSIAYQLARCSQPFRYALSRTMERNPDAHTRLPHDQFETLILQPLSDEKVKEAFPTNMVVVIDALDECDDVKSTKQILEVLLTKSNYLPIKFVVSSRPESSIRELMETNGTWVDARVVLHELDSGEVKADIKTYLTVGLEPMTPSEAEIEQLAARAGVLFIYASTVIRYVGYDDFGRNPRARLKAILVKPDQHVKAQTKDIDELYALVLRAPFDDSALSEEERGDMKLILDTVICAREPLTIVALNNLLQLDDVDRVQAALRPLRSVLHVMGPCMTVTTLHASFPDYLLDSKRSGTWHCDAGTHHHLLTQRCFECIQAAKPQFNICRLESSYVLDNEVADLEERVQRFISTELRYACLYFFSHLDTVEAQATPDLTPLLSQFLTTHLLLWMEVRNLTNTFPATLGELIAARQWATRHGMTHDTVDLLSDAWRFASTFVSNPASQSTPHIYISMLPLLPSSSPIRKHYISRFQGMIGVEGTAIDSRKRALLAQWKFEIDVGCMARSPDGFRIAISGSAGYILLLDAYRGNKLLDILLGDGIKVQAMAFSPDSACLASGTGDGSILVSDVSTGQPFIESFQAHDSPISSILYSHDGSYIISASKDTIIRIWDALSGKPAITPLLGHTARVTSIAITSDDANLVSSSGDGTIRVWDMQSGKLVLDPLTADGGYACTIALSPDNSHIISGSSDGKIRVWDIQTGRTALGPFGDHVGSVKSMSISPDGTAIASTSDDHSVNIWDAASGKLISQPGPPLHTDSSTQHMSYSHDGTRIIFAPGDERIRIIDTRATAAVTEPFSGHTGDITSIDISPDGQRIVSGGNDKTLCIWELCQGTLLLGPLEGHTERLRMVRFSPDGSRIVSCADDSSMCQWDTQTGAAHGIRIEVDLHGHGEVISADYSRDGARIVSITYEGRLAAWNSSDGQSILGPIASPSQSRGVHAGFSPDGATVIAGYENKSIYAWDVQSEQLVFSHQGYGRSDVSSFEFSPNGLYYAQSYMDGSISVRNIHTGKRIPGEYEGHTDWVGSVRFSADSTRLVSGSDDHTVHVWDVETGKSLFGPLSGHNNWVSSVVITPDGKHVVSASHDSAIRVWNAEPKPSLNKDLDGEYADWVLREDGWVISGESRQLLWVPTNSRHSLMSPQNIALISPDGYVRLRFEDALIGKSWAGCWRNS